MREVVTYRRVGGPVDTTFILISCKVPYKVPDSEVRKGRKHGGKKWCVLVGDFG